MMSDTALQIQVKDGFELSIPDFLIPFRVASENFPTEEMQALANGPDRSAEVLPVLSWFLVEENLAKMSSDFMLPIYCFSFLGFWKCREAAPLMVRALSLPDDKLDLLMGDFITGGMERVLAAVSLGEMDSARSIIENPKGDEFARSVALRSLLIQWKQGDLDRERLVEYVGWLIREGLPREPGYFWYEVFQACEYLRLKQHLPDLDHAFESGWFAYFFSEEDRKYFEDRILLTTEPDLSDLDGYPDEKMLLDFGKWACYQPYQGHDRWDPADEDRSVALPYLRDEPKVGRNDPCLCASGKKYKKCCGAVA